ncbi:MAG: gluconokinase [Halanaerobiaceae bacterium]
MNILALEASTSAAKAVIYDVEKKQVLNSTDRTYGSDVGNVATQDPEGVWQCLQTCARELLQEEKVEIDMVAPVSTWHSFLLLDEEREPVGEILTWANSEAADYVRQFRDENGLDAGFYRKTGCPVHGIYPLWKWMYLRETGQITLPDRVNISSKPGYIFEQLTGEPGVSRSTASGTGLLNIYSLDWDDDILDFSRLNRGQLAPLRELDYRAPLKKSVAKKLGLNSGVPVMIPGPDGAFNQIGSGALSGGIMTLSVGTSGALRMAVREPLLPERPSTWCYYAGGGKRLAGAAISGAGNCVNWFKEQVNHNNSSLEELDSLAAEVIQSEAPYFLPFLYGERCPGWRDGRTGGFCGLRGNHSTGQLYYAILEGILFNLYHCYRILVEEGESPEEINVSGGIVNSPLWLQMAADIFSRELVVSRIKDASSLGAVAVALKAAGILDSLADFSPAKSSIIRPGEERTGMYRERFDQYLDWYTKT